MSYFLSREDARPGGGGSGIRMVGGRPPPMQAPFGEGTGSPGGGNPGSPLSRFVQEGYAQGGQMMQQQQQQQQGGGFDAGIAQQWQGNVQQTRSDHQQQNDPNFIVKQPRNSGTRVSNAPGGASSLSLAWDDNPSGGGPSAGGGRPGGGLPRPEQGMAGCLGGGAWANQPNKVSNQQNDGASAYGGSAAGGRGGSRDHQNAGNGMAGIFGGGGGNAQMSNPSSRGSQRAASPGMRNQGVAASMAGAAYDSRATPSYGGVPYGGGGGGGGMGQPAYGGGGGQPSYGGGGGMGAIGGGGNFAAPPISMGGGFAAPPPMQPTGARYGGGAPGQSDQTSLSFGGRADRGSSNAYASGANQNCGNGITDRRTTKVLEPPGGRSQISFG